MLNSYGMFCKVFDFVITFAIIYELLVVPFLLVFRKLYEAHPSLRYIEIGIDILMVADIATNFIRWSRDAKTLEGAAWKYFKSGYVLFDCLATIPCLFSGEDWKLYGLKLIRIVHFMRILEPVELLLSYCLKSFSKKR